jgi:ABC-type glycerol-3-phosphate transport system permease component
MTVPSLYMIPPVLFFLCVQRRIAGGPVTGSVQE